MAHEPTREDITGWLEAVQEELDRLHDRLSPLLEEQRRLEARQALLKDLLSSFDVPHGATSSDEAGRPSWALAIQPTASIGDYVRDQAAEVLREAGRPLHINEIHAEFEQRGLHVPGAGRPVNLTVHLRKDPNIVSPSRGMYAVVEQVGQISVRRNARRRPKRARRPKAKEV